MANDEITRLRAEITRLSAEIARVRAEGDEEAELRLLRVIVPLRKEQMHYLLVKRAHKRVRAACARVKAAMGEVVEAQQNMYREEDALKDYLASRARVRTVRTKRARVEKSSEDTTAPESKRVRASD